MLTAQDKLNQALLSWYSLLSGWAADGSLASTAEHVLNLDGENAVEGADDLLQNYTSQWSLGDFESLPPIAISRQRLEAARAAIAQHDLEARRGQFIDKDVVAKEAFESGRRVRQALEALPYRLASTLAGELGLDAAEAGSVVQELMAAEIRLVLSLASDPDEAPGPEGIAGLP